MPFSTAWKLTEALLLQNRQAPFPHCHKPQLAQHVIKQNPSDSYHPVSPTYMQH